MGSKNSKRLKPEDLQAPIYNIMRKGYGSECVNPVPDWIECYGFPYRGSLSTNLLETIEVKLMEREKEVRGKKKSKGKVKDLEQLERHKKAMSMWKAEAARRDRQQQRAKEMCRPEKVDNEGADKSVDACPVSLYPVAQMRKVNLDLDSCPPVPPPPPYYVETVAATERRSQSRPSTQQMPSTGSVTPSAPRPAPDLTSCTLRMTQPRFMPDSPDPSSSWLAILSPSHTHSGDPCGGGAILPFLFEVPSTAGSQLAFQPWTYADMKEFMARLPDPATSGLKFADELKFFCQECKPTLLQLRRLLFFKMGLSDWSKLSDTFPTSTASPAHPDWEHDENMAYREAIRALCDAVKAAFPAKVDAAKIVNCRQGRDETVEQYYDRLFEIFNTYSGLEQPTQLGITPGMWEYLLCNTFLNGLDPNIAADIKKSCISWQEGRLSDVKRHAIHAEKQRELQREKQKQQREDELYKAAMDLYRNSTGRCPGWRGRRGPQLKAD